MLLVQSFSGAQSIAQLICVILLFFFVLFLAYMAARIAGSYQSNVMNKKSNIRVIEVYRLSNNKLIEIVKIGEKYLAIAVGKDEVTLLTELDVDEIVMHEASIEPINFKRILDKMKNEKQDKE
ncbi:MAG: flagellar biosynthetic protein FliO [Lachnospiraceae bacterium]|nr:flagellar biosynthetic protein FliO [Lachnospiraceae bacterium]HCJ06871.1 hypothetical protein [Lachnospiraceae bacterium]